MSFGRRLRSFLFLSLASIPRPLCAFALIGWIALLTAFALGRAPQLPRSGWSSFLWNFAHGPAYGLLAPLVLLCLPRSGGRIAASTPALAAGLATTAIVGLAHEILQGTTDHRSFSLWDWASDAAGAVSFLGLFRLCRDADPPGNRLTLFAALAATLCALPAWADSVGLSF